MTTEGLLEVIAGELGVILSISVASLLEPAGMTLVKDGAQLLGYPAVCRVANQDVVEAIGLLAFKVGRTGVDQARDG